MADAASGDITWYSPDPRAILPLDKFRVPRSLRQRIRKNPFDIRVDTAFETVMRLCASREETWISAEIIGVYTQLHRAGYAHSVEAWDGGRLVGGLYGVALGGAFFGESMFSTMADASKVALVSLVERLRTRGFVLLDTQFTTEHLGHFGVVEITRSEYLTELEGALGREATFADTS
jgi:leucyl/phenylalanyl-tRNA--protein transferase